MLYLFIICHTWLSGVTTDSELRTSSWWLKKLACAFPAVLWLSPSAGLSSVFLPWGWPGYQPALRAPSCQDKVESTLGLHLLITASFSSNLPKNLIFQFSDGWSFLSRSWVPHHHHSQGLEGTNCSLYLWAPLLLLWHSLQLLPCFCHFFLDNWFHVLYNILFHLLSDHFLKDSWQWSWKIQNVILKFLEEKF